MYFFLFLIIVINVLWVCTFAECIIYLTGNSFCGNDERSSEQSGVQRWIDGWMWNEQVVTTTEWEELETVHDLTATSNYTLTEEKEREKSDCNVWLRGRKDIHCSFFSFPATCCHQWWSASWTIAHSFLKHFLVFKPLLLKCLRVSDLSRADLFKAGAGSNLSDRVVSKLEICYCWETLRLFPNHRELLMKCVLRNLRKKSSNLKLSINIRTESLFLIFKGTAQKTEWTLGAFDHVTWSSSAVVRESSVELFF